jgi:hypothetical protein
MDYIEEKSSKLHTCLEALFSETVTLCLIHIHNFHFMDPCMRVACNPIKRKSTTVRQHGPYTAKDVATTTPPRPLHRRKGMVSTTPNMQEQTKV